MRIIGLDLGQKNIGVAVSDPLGFTAQGLTTIRRTNKENDIEKITSEKAKGYVHIINDVSENHTYNDAPLKKIHSDASKNLNRSRHYVQPQQKVENETKKNDGNRYSANRKF